MKKLIPAKRYASERGLAYVTRVLRDIQAGRLAAYNVNPGGQRPRWMLDPEDIRKYEDALRSDAGSRQESGSTTRRKAKKEYV